MRSRARLSKFSAVERGVPLQYGVLAVERVVRPRIICFRRLDHRADDRLWDLEHPASSEISAHSSLYILANLVTLSDKTRDRFARIQSLRRQIYDSADYQEGVRSFFERRPPIPWVMRHSEPGLIKVSQRCVRNRSSLDVKLQWTFWVSACPVRKQCCKPSSP